MAWAWAVVFAVSALSAAQPPRDESAPASADLLAYADGTPRVLRPAPVDAPPVPKSLDALARQLGDTFRYAQRDRFLVAADVGEEDFAVLVDGVLAYASGALRRAFFDARPPDTVTIYVFRDTDSYTAGLARHFGIRPVSPYGHFGHARNYLVVNYDTGPGTLVHELVHALMAPDFPGAPIWIAEGLASLYEQCRVEGGKLVGETNWRLPELQQALARQRIPALERLLAMTPVEFRARHESLHYATARYFCQFLQERGCLEDVYRRFRDHRADDPHGRRAVETAAGAPLPALEQAFHAWLAALRWE